MNKFESKFTFVKPALRIVLPVALATQFFACMTSDTKQAPAISYKHAVVVATLDSAILSDSVVSTGGDIASFSVSPSLPAGLTLNTSSGIISGSPSVISAATSYTITAAGSGGTGSAEVTITVIAQVIVYALPARYFKDSVQAIFDNRCTTCHSIGGYGWDNTGADSGGLDLTHAYASLVNKAAYEHQFVDSIPRLRAKPGFADSSYIYHKISMDDPGYGARMPYGGPNLPDSEIAVIKKWIQYGAPLGDTTTLQPANNGGY